MAVLRSQSTKHEAGCALGDSRAVSNHSDVNRANRITVRVLFGLFEADASGSQGICAVVAMFISFGFGRWLGLW